jgi:RimJ/RimL family protein N-acetyltransferase
LARRYHIAFTGAPTPDGAAFLEEETGVPFAHLDMRDWFCATAYNEHDAIVGVLLAEPRNWFDWHLSVAIADQQFMTRRLLRAIFKTLFTRARRITALVEPHNERALRQVVRMGFIYEGFCRCGIEGARDAYVFGMLPDDCRFLPGVRAAGTVQKIDITGEPLHG